MVTQQRLGELVVVGAGAAGLSAAYAAARRGFSVTCIEARDVGHPAASSAGWTKIFRYAYEDQKFSELLVDAEERWRDLERRSSRRLLSPCDGMNIGPKGSPVLNSIVCSLEAVGRRHEIVRAGSPRVEDLGIGLLPGEEAVLERGAGVFRPAEVLSVLHREARRRGVRMIEHTPVREVTAASYGLRVRTDRSWLRADWVIIAAGRWVHDLLPVPPVPLLVTRQWQLRFGTDRPIGDGHPRSWADLTLDDAYGVVNDREGWHVVGTHALGTAGGPGVEATDTGADAQAVGGLVAAVRTRLGGSRRVTLLGGRVCHYTSTEDREFLVTDATAVPGVVVLSACSGHGFKFVLTTGQQAVDLVAG